ncbi:MAG: hypothetical protein K0U89_18995, partial [Planctomycetes bacterium]|nr:hypothetical protein [Planctomycetota bacterium]
LSLFELPAMETSSSLDSIGLKLRPLHSGMHPSGKENRRLLLQEGKSLLKYVLSETPQFSLLSRYVRTIEQLRTGLPLGLRSYFLKFPSLLAVFDESKFKSNPDFQEVFWRIDAATVLSEATPRGAFHFLALGKMSGLFFSSLWIALTVLSEFFWRITSLAFLLIPNRHNICFKKEEV